MAAEPHNDQPTRRKRKAEDPDFDPKIHVHDESNWLVSYADMMTLLFCFFVLMYSFSKIDKEKFEVVRKEVAKFFGGKVKSDPQIKKVQEQIRKAVDESGMAETKIVSSDGRLQLRFQGAVLFQSGSAQLKPEMRPLIAKIVGLMKEQNRIEEIRVEGHTDDDPIHSQFYPTNWELSAARSSAIVRSFLEGGFRSDMLVAEGYADSRPLVPNQDPQGNDIPANKEQNRRVQIDITFGADPMAARNAMVSKEFVPTPGSPGAAKGTAAAPGDGAIPETMAAPDPAEEEPPKTPEQIYAEKLKAAQDRLKEAEAQAKRARELERIDKKIADTEKKAAERERKLGIQLATPPPKNAKGVMNMDEGLRVLERAAAAKKAADAAAAKRRQEALAKQPPSKYPTKKGAAPTATAGKVAPGKGKPAAAKTAAKPPPVKPRAPANAPAPAKPVAPTAPATEPKQ